MQEKSPLQWKKILLGGIASSLIGFGLSWLGAIALNAMYDEHSAGTVAIVLGMFALVPLTIAAAVVLTLVFVRERRLVHFLLTVAVTADLFVLLFFWFSYA